METVGIRALKQNASQVVVRAAAGEYLTVTDRGRPVALLTPVPSRRLDELVTAGRARAPRRAGGLRGLPRPTPSPDTALSSGITRMRDDERF